jgi:hypothetical protein
MCNVCGKTVEEAMLFNEGNGVWKCREHTNDKNANNPVLKDIETIILEDNAATNARRRARNIATFNDRRANFFDKSDSGG